jgi:hypothetical protein
MLLSIHIPKCAGTSFRLVLEQAFGERLWRNYGIIFNRSDARPEIVPPGVECIHGHFEADAFVDLFPEATFITWVRHPVDRLLSNYYYFLRCPNHHDHFSRTLHENKLSVREFADLEGMQNVAARHFAGKGVGDFRFIGVAERFAESLSVFRKFAGIKAELPSPYVNFNPERTSPRYELSSANFDYIAERNSLDLGFYQQAQARMEELVGSDQVFGKQSSHQLG